VTASSDVSLLFSKGSLISENIFSTCGNDVLSTDLTDLVVVGELLQFLLIVNVVLDGLASNFGSISILIIFFSGNVVTSSTSRTLFFELAEIYGYTASNNKLTDGNPICVNVGNDILGSGTFADMSLKNDMTILL
jgi:hypothetical protein